MGYPLDFHGLPVGRAMPMGCAWAVKRDAHGLPMGCQWTARGISIGCLWGAYNLSPGSP